MEKLTFQGEDGTTEEILCIRTDPRRRSELSCW